MIDSVAVIGDAGDLHTWSGTPFFFSEAARSVGWPAEPWRLRMAEYGGRRTLWNLARALTGRGIGGYQYSEAFLGSAEASVPASLWRGRILSFSQHFPRSRSAARRGGTVLRYIDATFRSFCGEDGLARGLPARVRQEACSLETDNYRSGEWVVGMSRWASESAVRDCGLDPARAAVILPGANLEWPQGHAFGGRTAGIDVGHPLVLGFVGKDWKRKGLPFLIEVRRELGALGVPAVVRCAGLCPEELRGQAGLEYVGFIDKSREPLRFIDFLVGCDVGCLFSSHEPLGISTLEFLRAGVPVAGFTVEGIADTLPPDAGFRFEPGTSAPEVALALRDAFDRGAQKARWLRDNAQQWSPRLTWKRCISEWAQLLGSGSVRDPVQPWRGLSPPS